ncbi:hypothetical protein HZS_4346 [Henneguya salminicola]|nr:hypothetical protein HZS_4346 [Henneguya salminicola]
MASRKDHDDIIQEDWLIFLNFLKDIKTNLTDEFRRNGLKKLKKQCCLIRISSSSETSIKIWPKYKKPKYEKIQTNDVSSLSSFGVKFLNIKTCYNPKILVLTPPIISCKIDARSYAYFSSEPPKYDELEDFILEIFNCPDYSFFKN